MRKITILMASILAMVGCAKNSDFDNTIQRNRVEMTVSAGKDMPEISRVAFNGDVTDMLWVDNDQIKIHIASTGETATFEAYTLSDDRKNARFRAEIYEPETIDSYYAYYPTTTGINGTNVNFIVPIETSTSATTPYMVASCEEVTMDQVNLEFKPVTALLELTLGFAAEKVVIEGNNNEYLAGILTYNCADGNLSQPAGSKSITLTAPAAGTYYLHVPEVTLSKGYKVTVTNGGQQMIKTVSYGKEKKFVAGEVTPLTIDKFEGVAVNLCDVYTTYTLYKRGNSEANNTSLTNTITFNGNCSFAGISSTLVKECGVNINGSNITATASNKQFSIANQTNQGQGTYKVYAYIKTVDGTVYKSAEQTHYITGLPYSVNMKKKNASDIGWTTTGTVTKSDYGLQIGYMYLTNGNKKNGSLFSPTFYLPANTNVAYSVYACYHTTGLGSKSVTLYSGVTTGTTANKSANSKSLSTVKSNGTPGDDTFTNCAYNAVLSAGSTERFYIGSSELTEKPVAEFFLKVRQFDVTYRW